MASSSSSKPTLEGRRLSEFLEEQQEPFLLDAYLSKNRYSDTLLRFRSMPRLLKLRDNIGLKKKGGIFKSILNKLVQAKVLSRAFNLNCVKKNHFKKFPRLDDQELSPSSVLDLHSHDNGYPSQHTTEEEVSSGPSSINSAEISWIFKQILKFYQSPAASKSSKTKSDVDLSKEEKIGDISSISHLIGLELTGTSKEWSDFQYEMRGIGSKIEALIFEEMREELVFDILDFHLNLKHFNCN